MKYQARLIFAVFLTTTVILHAYAQEGDVRDGLAVAQGICAVCHATRKGQVSPNVSAPTFEVIANVPGMTAIALQASLQTSHRLMPNLILSAEERRNVIAYILSLKPR
jgi:mono/diheme cytochrome c family protein